MGILNGWNTSFDVKFQWNLNPNQVPDPKEKVDGISTSLVDIFKKYETQLFGFKF